MLEGFGRVPTLDHIGSESAGTLFTFVYQVAGTPAEGDGVAGCEAERLKTISTACPSAPFVPFVPFWNASTGADHVSVESVPLAPVVAATEVETYTGSVPAGTLTDHDAGWVSACVPKLNEPPVGVAGADAARR